MVIHNVRKMVGWVTITLDDDLVVDRSVVDGDLSSNQVVELCHTVRHVHPDYGLLAGCKPLLDFIFRQAKTLSIVLAMTHLSTL